VHTPLISISARGGYPFSIRRITFRLLILYHEKGKMTTEDGRFLSRVEKISGVRYNAFSKNRSEALL
jgi:hypothetical protein